MTTDTLDTLRCTTLHQPWASLMAGGFKRNETRPRRLSHRGWLGIHAGLREPHPNQWGGPFAAALGNVQAVPLGKLLCVVRLVECERTQDVDVGNAMERAFGNYEPGRWAWITDRYVPLPDPPVLTGSQGIWFAPASVALQVHRYLQAVAARPGYDPADPATWPAWEDGHG